jgi:hypothetical protein
MTAARESWRSDDRAADQAAESDRGADGVGHRRTVALKAMMISDDASRYLLAIWAPRPRLLMPQAAYTIRINAWELADARLRAASSPIRR